jgi:hypothetical protein
MISKIKNYLKKRNFSFQLFDIKYTEQDKKTIQNFNINKMLDYSYYGKFDKDLIDKSLYNFILKIGNNSENEIKIIINIIYKLIDKITKCYRKEYIWLSIRVSIPNNNFDFPRWHIDGYQNSSKFVTTLIGPSTLLIDDTDVKSRDIYFDIQSQEMKEYQKIKSFTKQWIKINDKFRKIYSKKLKNCKIVQPSNDQGIIFLTDVPTIKSKNICIHSEPPINENRFFISIMCNDEKVIMNLHK